LASFIPDADNMTQAPADSVPGVNVDPTTGSYVIVTPEGFQIPLKPAISNPAEVASLLPDSKVVIGSGGQTVIEAPPAEDGRVTAIAGIPNPVLTPDERPAGTYTDGEGVNAKLVIVYENGTAQTLSPTISDQDGFKDTAAATPGVDDVNIRDDGKITLNFEGAPVTLDPLFDVVKALPGDVVVAGFSVDEVGNTFYTSKNGDKQQFALGGN